MSNPVTLHCAESTRTHLGRNARRDQPADEAIDLVRSVERLNRRVVSVTVCGTSGTIVSQSCSVAYNMRRAWNRERLASQDALEQACLHNVEQQAAVPDIATDAHAFWVRGDRLLIGEGHHVSVPGAEPTAQSTTVLDSQFLFPQRLQPWTIGSFSCEPVCSIREYPCRI